MCAGLCKAFEDILIITKDCYFVRCFERKGQKKAMLPTLMTNLDFSYSLDTETSSRIVSGEVIDHGSDIFGNPFFQKVLKISLLPHFKRPGIICIALSSRCVVPKLF